MSQPPMLSYSPRVRRWTVRRLLRWTGVAATVFVAILSWRKREAISERISFVYWQRECENYVMPVDLPLLNVGENSADFRSLQLHPDYHLRSDSMDDDTPSHKTAIFIPYPWRKLHPPPAKRSFFLGDERVDPTLFLGSRTSPNGTRWIIHAAAEFELAGGGDMSGFMQFTIRFTAQKHANMFTHPADRRFVQTSYDMPTVSKLAVPQADPNNPSKIAMHYAAYSPPPNMRDPFAYFDVSATFDLMDDGTISRKTETSNLTYRDPRNKPTPATSPATQTSPP